MRVIKVLNPSDCVLNEQSSKFQVKAIVEKVGINFGVEVPLSGEQTSAGILFLNIFQTLVDFLRLF